MSERSALHDIDMARQDDERAWRDFAGCDDALACRIGFAFSKPRQPIDLRRLEHGKHLIAPGFDEWMVRLRHGVPDGHAGCALVQPCGSIKHDPHRARRTNLAAQRISSTPEDDHRFQGHVEHRVGDTAESVA
jgi:hypothetical protein